MSDMDTALACDAFVDCVQNGPPQRDIDPLPGQGDLKGHFGQCANAENIASLVLDPSLNAQGHKP